MIDDIENRLTNSVLYQAMLDNQKWLDNYPAHSMDIKPKRMRLVEEALDGIAPKFKGIWHLHVSFTEPMNNYRNSVVLACNEKVIPYMIREAAAYMAGIDVLKNSVANFKSVSELVAYYKNFVFSKKTVLNLLLLDIEKISLQYGLEFDKKFIVNEFNDAYTAQI